MFLPKISRETEIQGKHTERNTEKWLNPVISTGIVVGVYTLQEIKPLSMFTMACGTKKYDSHLISVKKKKDSNIQLC